MRSISEIQTEMRTLGRPLLNWARSEASKAAIRTWEGAHPESARLYRALSVELELADRKALEEYRAQRARPQLPTVTSSAAADPDETSAVRDVRSYLQGRAVACLVLGPVGTGKSVAAQWAVDRVKATGRSARFVRAGKVGQMSAWDDASNLDNLEKASLLVLDDIGTEGPSEHARNMVRGVLDVRLDRSARTIVTSNLVDGALSAWLGTRIADRLRASCVVVTTTGESMRGRAESRPQAEPIEWLERVEPAALPRGVM